MYLRDDENAAFVWIKICESVGGNDITFCAIYSIWLLQTYQYINLIISTKQSTHLQRPDDVCHECRAIARDTHYDDDDDDDGDTAVGGRGRGHVA